MHHYRFIVDVIAVCPVSERRYETSAQAADAAPTFLLKRLRAYVVSTAFAGPGGSTLVGSHPGKVCGRSHRQRLVMLEPVESRVSERKKC